VVAVASAIDQVDVVGHSLCERAVRPGIDFGIEGSGVGCMHILCSHKVHILRIRKDKEDDVLNEETSPRPLLLSASREIWRPLAYRKCESIRTKRCCDRGWA
jgi:hypothetical protein